MLKVCFILIGIILSLIIVGGIASIQVLKITNDQITQLEQQITQQGENLLSANELTELSNRVNDTTETFLLHKNSHPLFPIRTQVIINALYLYESVIWADAEQNSLTARTDLELLIPFLADDKLAVIWESVNTEESDPSFIWLRLQFLFWESLQTNADNDYSSREVG